MDMFAEFLFESERVVPSTSSFHQSSHQQHGTDDESNNDDDDRTATNTTASTSTPHDNNNDNSNSEMPSSEDSDYGHHVEVMVSGMLELQRQQQLQQEEDDATSYFSGSTIVSSAPSVPTIGADPYLGQNRLARRVQSSAALSLSTASSQFLDLDNDRHEEEEENQKAEAASVASSSSSVAAREPSSSSSIDFTSSVIDSSISFRSSWSRPIMQGYRLGDAMEITDTAGITNDPRRRAGSSQTFTTAVQAASSNQLVLPTGRGMILRNSNNNNNTGSFQNGMWYAHFTDADWDAFRQRAQMVVKSLFTTSMPQRPLRDTYQLPPRPPALLLCHAVSDPTAGITEHTEQDHRSNADKATDCGLPSCFLCPLCEDVIVGAITLDCGCQRNVCAACWEYHCVAQKGLRRRALQQLALECDYVIVPSSTEEQEQQTAVCPNCFREVHEALGCHALDVAIAQLMLQQQHHQQHGRQFRAIWESYVQRVEHWREELVRRQVENEPSPLETLHQEQHVARLIEEEETYWKRQQQQRQRAAAACGGGFLGMAVAVMASMGMKLLMAQTVRAIQNGRP